MKQFNQVTRHKIFSVVQVLLKTNMVYLKTVNDPFITTYIHLTSGEKDPRNLMLSFEIASTILKSLDVEKHVEELFDVTFCYFPITFEPPKNDPYGITSDDLRQGLRNCISANSLFAKDAFPGLLEKLTSSSMKVKNDTLITIAQCVKNYEPDSVGSHWKDLWDGLKFEIIHGSEEGTPELTLNILRELAASLEKASDQSLFESYMESIITETKENIKEIQSKKALPSILLSSGIAAGSPAVFNRIADTILAHILAGTTEFPTIAAQKVMLDMVGLFVSSSTKFPGENVLMPYKDRIIEFYSKSLMGTAKTEVHLRLSAVSHFSEITQIEGFLSKDEIGLIVQYLDDVVLDDNKQELKDEALNALVIISNIHVDLVLTLTFPAFLAQLPDTETPENTEVIDRILYALSKICVNRSTFEVLSVRLLNKVTSALRGNCSRRYPEAIFTTLLSVVVKLSETPDMDISIYTVRLLPDIFSKFAEKYQDEANCVLFDTRVLHPTCILITLVVQAADQTKQTQFVENLMKTFWFAQPSKLISSKVFKPASMKPLAADSKPSNIIALFTAALGPIRKEIPLGVDSIDLINNSISILSSSQDPSQRLNYLRLIALVSNKWTPKQDDMKSLIDTLVSQIKNGSIKESLGSLEVFTWIAKAYILKTDSFGYTLLENLLSLLDDAKLGPFVSKALDVLGDDDLIVSKENGAVVRLLAKQRFFSFVLPPLVSKFKETYSFPEVQANYLVALSGVLRHMPPKVISNDVPVFFPLLLQSLTIKDPKVREASISTITATLYESSAIVAQHISSLVPQLLTAASEKTSPSSKVRLAALNCLGEFPQSIERKDIEPFRITIIKGLNVPLDDKRRDVRRAAVNARQKYFELNAAPEE